MTLSFYVLCVILISRSVSLLRERLRLRPVLLCLNVATPECGLRLQILLGKDRVLLLLTVPLRAWMTLLHRGPLPSGLGVLTRRFRPVPQGVLLSDLGLPLCLVT